ncbi:MAG: ATP-dependent protease ATPase subunit HslU [Christensenellales bacterium]|jgi:ATP-dependent HslUV protease ATP-binding subunit HslU|nr:ATP-dependent protease ATPase subunit HslU [Clostridiales bacterium]MBD9283567.1 ATP-dependent protease ATPase subunit HslU [Clostridiales bacterium]HCE15492.1 HslU--HslV peptidase ATPase subunit [Clostridiales bacterium]HCV68379.1 HslU--HslV peptidase ATPase subunit [Clostridiales bacterium]
MAELTPRQIVRELDRYIVGQDEAKRAVAIALRNRYRRSKVDDAMREEISPKNILMIGPTGVGKTEIARRLAKLVSAPFIKVEATKFTEVGYVGRDVESIVRDLVENAIRMVREEHTARVAPRARVIAEDRLVTLLVNPPKKPSNSFSLDYLLGRAKSPETPAKEENAELADERERLRQQLMKGEIEDRELEIEVEEAAPSLEVGGSAISLGDMMGNMMPKKTKLRRVKVKEARKILEQEEADKLIDQDAVQEEAIRRAEQDGIVFIDEIDKIAGRRGGSGPDVSREGVQRDILPIVEGSTVNTKYGPVKTDYMLFIAAGAFHVAKVSDLIPELQGRFPVHVQLKSLTREDFQRILTQPDNALTLQYKALLAVDKVMLTFEDSAIEAIADAAFTANETAEDIGARRLHAVFEQVLEDISFNAGDENMPPFELTINGEYVQQHLSGENKPTDLRKYIL